MIVSALRTWLLLLGGLVVWAVHFFLLYAFASIYPGTDTARWLTAAATVVALLANAAIIRAALAARRHDGDTFDRWSSTVAIPAGALSAAAVVWQGIVALF